MKAEDLSLEELVDFSEGSIGLRGRRLVLHDTYAFARFRKDLIEMIGPEQARRILTRLGYFWGQSDAAGMKRIFKWEDVTEWLKAGPRLHALQGVCRPTIKSLKMPEKDGAFEMEVVWRGSVEAQEHLEELGPAKAPSCWIMTGYASGYASFCLAQSIYFIERQCRVSGDRQCVAVGKDEASWGEELTPYLPYFQGDDITGKIKRLTAELKRKNRELNRQRRRLDQLEGGECMGMTDVRSASFKRVLDLAHRIAPYDTSILITGESGTGKEVLARCIHRQSKRSKESFLTINCTALPETLLESELFGHKSGSFTGASYDRTGLFEQGNGGTVFLDEIGDISPATQLKLLRVLQEREIKRVGESKPRKIDVRVIAATNRDLMGAVREGAFREDLLYRLRVIEVPVPPLRDRREDILPLARYFVKRFGDKLGKKQLRLDTSTIDCLSTYTWPGNVRELENAVEHAAVLCREKTIQPEDLPPGILQHSNEATVTNHPLRQTLAAVEASHIRQVMRLTDDNRSRAAEILGINPTTLWRKLKTLQESDSRPEHP